MFDLRPKKKDGGGSSIPFSLSYFFSRKIKYMYLAMGEKQTGELEKKKIETRQRPPHPFSSTGHV
jgi:hypothetical protein